MNLGFTAHRCNFCVEEGNMNGELICLPTTGFAAPR